MSIQKKAKLKIYESEHIIIIFGTNVSRFQVSKNPISDTWSVDCQYEKLHSWLKKNQQNKIVKHYLVVKVISKITFRRNKITIKTKFNNFFVVCTFLYLISIKYYYDISTNLLNRIKCLWTKYSVLKSKSWYFMTF